MRVAIISREYPWESPWGGMANFYTHMAQALKGQGHWVEVFSQGFHKEYTEIVDGITVHRIQARLGSRYIAGVNGEGFPFHRFTTALAKRFAECFLSHHKQHRYDVVESHDHLGVSSALPRLDIPMFLTGHTTLAVFQSFPGFDLGVRGSVVEVWKQEYRAHLQADRIRFLSQDLLNRTCGLFPGISHKSSVVFNPCHIPETVDSSSFESNPCSFLFVGRLEPRKGVQLLPAALKIVWRQFPEVTVTLVGQDIYYKVARLNMSEFLKQECGDRANQLVFLGWKPKPEVDTITQLHPYVLVPSLYDNSAFAAQEGMAYGRCVLCSDSGGTKEYVGEAGYTFRANDTESLAKAMLTCLLDRDRSLQLAKQAAEKARRLFARERFAREFVTEVLDYSRTRQSKGINAISGFASSGE